MAVAEKIVPTSTRPGLAKPLPAIPAKRYFTIGEVSDLCQVKPYVLRYWEQEFTQLKPMKRRGNRRYYQHHEVLLIRRIRDLLYDQGFTISGARNRLGDAVVPLGVEEVSGHLAEHEAVRDGAEDGHAASGTTAMPPRGAMSPDQLRIELLAIRRLLTN
jgi:DNA-binding transcriptional MerR regulator